jgi:hypothetical protein
MGNYGKKRKKALRVEFSLQVGFIKAVLRIRYL